jgi:hypothetical protein
MDSDINFSLSRKKQKLEIPDKMEVADNITKTSNKNIEKVEYQNQELNQVEKKDHDKYHNQEQEEENISDEPYSKCSGCYPKFQPNQLAHCEDKNGCLYVETDDSLTYSP